MDTTIWSPLASDMLTGKYNEGTLEDSRLALPDYEWLKDLWTSEDGKQKLEKVRVLTALANDIGVSITHLPLA
jgi:aryl-alcohol dehydrogenase-like predicted oxidoreductase